MIDNLKYEVCPVTARIWSNSSISPLLRICSNEDGEKYLWKYLPDNQHKLFIYEDEREIKQGRFTLLFGYDEVELEDKWIQDLIKADLVVKE